MIQITVDKKWIPIFQKVMKNTKDLDEKKECSRMIEAIRVNGEVIMKKKE